MCASGMLIDVDRVAGTCVSKDWVVEPPKFRLAPRWPELRNIELYLSKEQQTDGGTIDGKKLLHELRDREHIDTSYLDYLLVNQNHIPISWTAEYFGRPLHIFFVGVTYRNKVTGQEFARCMRYINGRWLEGYAAVWSDWHPNNAVAVVKPELSQVA